MSGLDPLGRRLVVDIIKEYNANGHTILFCSHVLTDVERICHRIGIMNKGKLEAMISPRELAGDGAVSASNGASPLEAFFMRTVQGKPA
jgi:ABC-2 type transport system ATP-binding protein